jgi:hypothetical protein
MNQLIEQFKKELGCNFKEARYLKDIVKAYILKESDSYYSLLPDLLQIIEGDFSDQDRINDLGIVLSLYYRNEPTYQNADISASFIEQDIENNMTEFRERLSDSELVTLAKKIENLYFKL